MAANGQIVWENIRYSHVSMNLYKFEIKNIYVVIWIQNAITESIEN